MPDLQQDINSDWKHYSKFMRLLNIVGGSIKTSNVPSLEYIG